MRPRTPLRGRTAYLRRRSRARGPEAGTRPRGTPSHVWYLWQNWNRQVSIETAATSSRFAVIGAGRLGASLALALRTRGFTLVGFTSASPEGRERAQGWLNLPAAASVAEIVALRPDLYFLCVPDGVVADVAAELGAALSTEENEVSCSRVSGRSVVVHTSGATSVSVLTSCEIAGAAALVFHPLQTFPEPLTGASRFAGAGVAITPGPARPDVAGASGLELADRLGMRPFFLADDKRGLYHAAATVACNYLVTLEHVAARLFVKAGVPERVILALFLPLVRATLDNLASRGPADALTGPLSRGDAATVAAHLEALNSDAPETLPLYRALGEATLQLVATREEVEPAVMARMKELLTGPN